MYGIKGVDHIARDGLLETVIAGSYLSGSVIAADAGDLADAGGEQGRGV
ncbi:MAG: hypothetical protein R3D03_01235 [Geminicoccaceae bacterium]